MEDVDTDRSGLAAACVTLIVRAVTPVPLTVMIAVRAAPVLAFAMTVTVPLFEPFSG